MSDITPREVRASVVDEGDEVQLGQWYWVSGPDSWGDEGERLGCVTHVGSNYVQVEFVGRSTRRVGFAKFFDVCRFEPNADAVIQNRVAEGQGRVRQLMAEIEEITQRLGVGNTPNLPAATSEGAALAKLGNANADEYKTDLVKTKEETLPALFKKIDKENEKLVAWMKATLIPLNANMQDMREIKDKIEGRIFNVDLYAGLTEDVTVVAGGEPAELTDKIHLMQRRCYMDEECLANYEVGGMEFNNIHEFDVWLARKENRDRILPFPRTVVSFRVRRKHKSRPVPTNFVGFFSILDGMKADMLTFMYIRNGEQIFRVQTQMDFGHEMFPDTDHHILTYGGKLWAKSGFGETEIITHPEYEGKIEEYKKAQADFEAGRALADPREKYKLFEPGNIYYDDIKAKLDKEAEHFNRIGILIQGLLDRSLTFHPHPPWKIWSAGGFNQALELVYDSSRALHQGDKPDFEAYRSKLNASLKTGSITVGQQEAWREAWREAEDKRPQWHNDGPGTLARVEKYEPRKKRCNYAWLHRKVWGEGETRAKFKCDQDQILNVEAYTPGDFKIFFADPRTREEYLEWAPLLLEAEEYHAGNREEPPEAAKPIKRGRSWESERRLERKRAGMAIVGKVVKIKSTMYTNSNEAYAEGTLWKVEESLAKGLTLSPYGREGRMVTGVSIRKVEVVEDDVV